MNNNQNKINNWRFIDNSMNSGTLNMAIDESFLLEFSQKREFPVLRIYQWENPTISIGRFQNPQLTLDIDQCRKDKIDIVRRITGGTSIFHTPDEITYSICCMDYDIGEGLSVKETYKKLCGFLIYFYKSIGFTANFAVDLINDEKLGVKSALCFASKEEYDIIIDGKKIGGNAQKRIKHTIFQHGSIPLKIDFKLLRKYIKDIPSDIEQKTTSLNQLGVSEGLNDLKELIKSSFNKTINPLSLSKQTYDEIVLSKKLKEIKYSNDLWNIQGETIAVY